MNVGRRAITALGLVLAAAVLGCNAVPVGDKPTAGPSASPSPLSTPLAATPSPAASAPSLPTSSPASTSTPFAVGQVTSAAQAAALVFASDPKFGSLSPSDPRAVGQSASYEAYDTGNGYSVAITMGSGDCPSSCINTHTWNYSVAAEGKITLVSEQGDPVEISIDHGTSDPATVTLRLVAGPVCAVERNPPDPSCAPRPVPNVEIIIRDPSGAEVTRGTAGDDGTLTVSLPGGAYYAEPDAAPGVMGQAQPEAFSVPGGRSVTVTMEYDTGIR